MKDKGFTLIEVLVGVSIFVVVVMAVYQSYASVYATVASSHLKISASDLVNEQFEIARNLPFQDVGIVGGIPNGKIPHIQNITRDRVNFIVTSTIRNVDDSFDGMIGASPNDLSPADYKLLEVEVSCSGCKSFEPVSITGRIAPKNLETASTNGALFVQVFDANGQPVEGADIHIFNASTSPTVTIDDTTNAQGMLQVVDAPPYASSYRITASKSGYSTDQTYPAGAAGNPTPTKPHATVALQQVTQVSFAIDRTSILDVSSVESSCNTAVSFPFTMKGSKLIGTPSVYKYNQSFTTDAGGLKNFPALEWDTYSFTTTSSTHEIRGTNPQLPLALLPNAHQSIQLIVGPKNPNTLLVSVSDSSTGLPISGATVTISNGSPQTLYTGEGSITQTDWSGGAGQATSTNLTQFESSSGVSVSNPAGDATLSSSFGVYASTGSLISSAFDTGATSTFQELIWNPVSEPVAAGTDSVKFQFASNFGGGPWNFKGPDGTSASYYTLGNRDLSTIHSSGRFGKYKLFLSTASTAVTPNLSDVSFTFTSGCVPPGQVAFSGLSSGTYDITVAESGYTTYTGTVSVTLPWQLVSVSLAP